MSLLLGCQGLLTVGVGEWGGALQVLERGIRLEGLGEMLGALHTDGVVVEATNEGAIGVSAAADSRISGVWRRT